MSDKQPLNDDLEEIVVLGDEIVDEAQQGPSGGGEKKQKRWRDTSPSYASIAAESTSMQMSSGTPPSYRSFPHIFGWYSSPRFKHLYLPYRRFSSPKPSPTKGRVSTERRSSGILRTDPRRRSKTSSLGLGQEQQLPHSPAPSTDRQSVSFAMDDSKRGTSILCTPQMID